MNTQLHPISFEQEQTEETESASVLSVPSCSIPAEPQGILQGGGKCSLLPRPEPPAGLSPAQADDFAGLVEAFTLCAGFIGSGVLTSFSSGYGIAPASPHN